LTRRRSRSRIGPRRRSALAGVVAILLGLVLAQPATTTLCNVVDPSDQACLKGTMTGELVTVHGTLLLNGAPPQCVNVTFGYGNYPVTITGSDGFAGVTSELRS
jgi:hypothetical protein